MNKKKLSGKKEKKMFEIENIQKKGKIRNK